MPGRLRQPTTASTEITPGEPAYTIPGLDYDEALGWKAGRAIATADLLARLQKLAGLLRKYDQDIADQAAVLKLARDLANPNLLGHKDRGVRALAIVCIVDLLRICAPNAPFSTAELKSIFTTTITSILPNLIDPSHAYNAQHVYILSSLSEYKSICLILDVNNADSLILPLFSTCFDIVSGAGKSATGVELGKTVEYNLNVLLATLIDEVPALPQDVTDIILSQFLRIDPRTTQTSKSKRRNQDDKQAKLLLKEYPPAYNMAKAICTTCPERMTTQISHYFSNVIVDASEARQSHSMPIHGRRISDLDISDDEDEEIADLSKAHRLIRELWRACPDVLLNVIPQIEAELSAESLYLRLLATETLGDVIAGVGVAGMPPSNVVDPAAYPLPTIDQPQTELATSNRLLSPMSPKPFATVHAAAYQSLLGRRHDKAAPVRAAWATAVSRIMLTSAGGIGFSETDEEVLLEGLTQMLGDADERVRTAAIRGIADFGYTSLVNRLGSVGGILTEGSVLNALANRVRDRKHAVREEAIIVLGRFWGVASRDIEHGDEKVTAVLGDAPSRILEAYYTNEPGVHALLDKVMFEFLLPIAFPPIKVQILRSESQKERAKDKEGESQEGPTADPDAIRARRLLTLVRGLSDKAKQVFFAMQARQVQLGKIMTVFLKACEDYNGGVVEENEEVVKAQLTKVVDGLSRSFANPTKVSLDLWKFAEMHDRRNYQLLRFATGPANDYRTVTKAIKELTKRIQMGPSNSQSLLDTIIPLLHRCSLLIYNRSHVPSIMEISRSDENGLADSAHEVLKQISSRNPEVLKTYIEEMCRDLEADAPTATREEDYSAADALKACAAYARRYPAEVSKDRRFLTSLTNYALFAKSPRAAKHAVSIIMAVAEKREMYAKDILQKALKGWKLDAPHAICRLSAISQLCLLAPTAVNSETEAILQIAMGDIVMKKGLDTSQDESSTWSATPSLETIANDLALKILVNRCRSEDTNADNSAETSTTVTTVYKLLMTLIENDGEINPSSNTPPSGQRFRLRLAAAKSLLKLASHRRQCEDAVTPTMFNAIAQIVLNPPLEVRLAFVNQLRKYLGQNRLGHRWFVILFLLAFEPDTELKSSTVTWLKSRVRYFLRRQHAAQAQGKGVAEKNVMELLLTRLLSLLAHHPDYPDPDLATFDVELVDFAKYFVFYLSAVASEDNLSLIYHVAQRVKQARDAVTGTDEVCERLYTLSDLATATIRHYADLMPAHAKGGVNLLQTWPGKMGLPTSLFAPLKSHQAAVEVAEKNYLSERVEMELEHVVRDCVKGRKSTVHRGEKRRRRKSQDVDIVEDPDEDDDHDDDGERKRHKKLKRVTSLPVRKAKEVKTPKRRKSTSEAPSSELPSRKSTRASKVKGVSYAEEDSEEEEDQDDIAVNEELLDYAVTKSASVKSTFRKPERARSAIKPVQEPEMVADDEAEDDDEKENKALPDHDHNYDHDDEEEEEVEEDVEMVEDEEISSSPLKDKSNTPKQSSKAKATGKISSASEAGKRDRKRAAAKGTRQTRATRT